MVGYTVFAHVILKFGILYLWLYYWLVDRELSRHFPDDPSRRQVGHPWNRLLAYNTHMHSAQQLSIPSILQDIQSWSCPCSPLTCTAYHSSQ